MYFVRLFVLACVDIPQTHNYCVHEFTYNAAVLVESVSQLSATGIAGTFSGGSIGEDSYKMYS